MAINNLALMRRIDALHLKYPFAGARMLRDLLAGKAPTPFGSGLPPHIKLFADYSVERGDPLHGPPALAR